MFLKRKINRILLQNQQQNPSKINKSPLEITKDLVNFFEWKDFFSGNYYGANLEKNELDNTIVITSSLPKSKSILPYVEHNCLPNLKLISIREDLFDMNFSQKWIMNSDDYQNIYNRSRWISELSDYLSRDFLKAFQKVHCNQTDEAYQLLLIQHAPSFENIIQTLKKSILETSNVSYELAQLHLEILSNFVDAVNKRAELISSEKKLETSSFSKILEDEMKKEILYQRKMLGLPVS